MSAEDILTRYPAISGLPIFLSGPIGTQLALRDVPINDYAALNHPDVLRGVHDDYASAGAGVLLTDTFSVSGHRLHGDHQEARRRISAAYQAAQGVAQAYPHRTAVAGSLTSLGDCYKPEDTPDDITLDREHLLNFLAHKTCHPDFIICETLPTLREAVAMGKAAVYCGLPYILSFTVDDDGNLLDGNSIDAAERVTRSPLRIGIGANCCSTEGAKEAVRRLSGVVSDGHIVAYPNGYKQSRSHFNCSAFHDHDVEAQKAVHTPREFAGVVEELVGLGATLVGGCCGATPDHTRAYVGAFGSEPLLGGRSAVVGTAFRY